MSPLVLLGLVAVGVLAGIVNTLAGGGSLLTLPALMFAGLPAATANGTNRVGVLWASLTATASYRRSRTLDRIDAVELVPALVGSLLGSWVSLDVDEATFRRVVGVVLLLMLGVVLAKPKAWLEGRANAAPGWARALGFFVVGAYGGFLQAGVGVLLLAAFVLLSGHDLLRSNARKVLIVAAFTVPALVVFVLADAVAWVPGIALGLGSAVGGWLGARVTVAWGPQVVRWALVVAVVVSSSRLLGLW